VGLVFGATQQFRIQDLNYASQLWKTVLVLVSPHILPIQQRNSDNASFTTKSFTNVFLKKPVLQDMTHTSSRRKVSSDFRVTTGLTNSWVPCAQKEKDNHQLTWRPRTHHTRS
jgi:hypothetical protein